jgi:hypothetical protein
VNQQINRTFIEMYKINTAYSPPRAANAYDIVNIIVNATEKSGTGRNCERALQERIFGKLTIDPEGFVISKAAEDDKEWSTGDNYRLRKL